MFSKSKILLIYTGGTIGMIKDFETGALKAFNFNKLLKNIPELQLLDCEIDTFSFDQPIDSSNMNPQHWAEIALTIERNYKDFDGFVVLHGSDTMSYSASALSFMLENLAKPVIFTGSQLPIGDLRTDAKENLITAIQIASLQENGKPLINEVCLYFEYKLYRGNRTTKINAEHFRAFVSPNYPFLVESGVHLKVNSDLFLPTNNGAALKVHTHLDNNVALIKMFPGISETVLSAILNIESLRGIVLETYGAGNAPTEDWFLSLLQKAVTRGLVVVNVTQCSIGSVSMGHYETSTSLKNLGIISGKDITTEAAIAKLMFLLGQNIAPEGFKNVFETSLRGEMQ
jgi:L-asparaginase